MERDQANLKLKEAQSSLEAKNQEVQESIQNAKLLEFNLTELDSELKHAQEQLEDTMNQLEAHK